jgi:hypothetical protein
MKRSGQANKSYEGNPFGSNASRLPNVPHGLNDYAGYHNIAFLSALHPTPDHYCFLANHGLDATAVYNAIYHQAVYQSVMRTALRNPANQHPIKIFVSDIGAAQYLQSVFAGAKLVKIDSGIVENATPKRGRRRKWQDDADRKRERRQQAREQQIQVLNKQLNLILKLPYVNLAGIGVDESNRDTSSNRRPENTIILYSQKRTPLRPSVRSSKTQSEQSHTEVFVDNYRNVDCCGTIYAHKQANEPLAYLKWENEERYVAVLATAYMRKLRSKASNYLISPAIFDPTPNPMNGKRRGEDNIVYCRHVVLDFENGAIAPKNLPALFPDIRMVLTNSFSSTQEKPRFRVIIPTNQPMTPEVYKAIYECIATKLEDGGYYVGNRKRRGNKKPSGLDWSKRNPTSLFYLPCLAKDEAASFFTYYDDAGRKTLNPVTWITNTKPEPAEPEPVWEENDHQDVNHAIVDTARCEWRATPKGQGNDAFFRFALKLRKAGLSPAEIKAILTEEAGHAHSPKDRLAQIKGIMNTLFEKRRRAERSGAERSTCEASSLGLGP